MKLPYSLLFIFVALQSLVHADPERVLIIGDSMMRVTAHSTNLALERRGEVESRDQTSLGSGLARLDAYDWMGEIDKLVSEFDPDVSMVWFGTNDRQPMRISGQGIVQLADPAWAEEYARRVAMVMDKLTAREGAKVYWLELPVMRDESVTRDVEFINEIIKAEAEKRDQVIFFPTNPILTRRQGRYAPVMIGQDGRPVKVRDDDGVHLSRAGADRVAEAFLEAIFD